MITLYQFQFSHFCEKARWALDYKGVPYMRKNLLPGPHMKTARRWAPKTSVPILVDDDTVIQDSAAIITFLDQRFPHRPLTPQNPDDAKEAVKWEEHLDEEIGVPLRLWFYYHALPDRDRAVRFLLDGAPWYGKPLFAFIFPQVRAAMLKGMNIHAESARQSEERLLAALEKLDAALKDRQFLVADSFSRADLAACALLSPYCAPGRSDAEMTAAFPAALCALRERHKNRRFFAWVLDTYSNHRQPGAPGTSKAWKRGYGRVRADHAIEPAQHG